MKACINPALAAPVSKGFKKFQVETKFIRSRSYDPNSAPAISSPDDVKAFVKGALSKLPDSDRERILAIYLNTKNKVVGVQELSVGGRSAAMLFADTIARTALLANASGVIIAHNHPSGDPTPSPEDKATTLALAKTLKPFEINVLDHVVIGSGGKLFSMKGTGALNPKRKVGYAEPEPQRGLLVSEMNRNPIPNAFEAGEKVIVKAALRLRKRGVVESFKAGQVATIVSHFKKDRVVINFRGYVGVVEAKDLEYTTVASAQVPRDFVIKEEKHPLKKEAVIYRIYHADGTPLYKAYEDLKDAERNVKEGRFGPVGSVRVELLIKQEETVKLERVRQEHLRKEKLAELVAFEAAEQERFQKEKEQKEKEEQERKEAYERADTERQRPVKEAMAQVEAVFAEREQALNELDAIVRKSVATSGANLWVKLLSQMIPTTSGFTKRRGEAKHRSFWVSFVSPDKYFYEWEYGNAPPAHTSGQVETTLSAALSQESPYTSGYKYVEVKTKAGRLAWKIVMELDEKQRKAQAEVNRAQRAVYAQEDMASAGKEYEEEAKRLGFRLGEWTPMAKNLGVSGNWHTVWMRATAKAELK